MATRTCTYPHQLPPGSLAPPPTENTAPVHKFRGLYTRDLHKKSKKWHDGLLDFHTFNRRVMVYDDARNFIGDLHYREGEDLDEGVELRLDRGILVEVGERLGETQTDLAPLLDRQRPDKGPTPSKKPIARVAHLPSVGLSQRPKSLLEVLGPSQGRLGRAKIPYQSPYEQKHNFPWTDPIERPRKRRRLSINKENHSDEIHENDRPARTARSSLHQREQRSKPARPPMRQEEPPIEFEEVHDLSSDDEPRSRPLQPERVARPAQSTRRKESLLDGPTSLERPRFPPQRNPRDNATGIVVPGTNEKEVTPAREPRRCAIRSPLGMTRPPAVGSARLLISQAKPRQKLTCILPFTTNASGKQVSERSGGAAAVGRDNTSSSSFTQPPRGVAPEDVQTGVLEPELLSPDLSTETETPVQDLSENLSSSPLFVPENDPPSQQPGSTNDDYPFADSLDTHVFEDLEMVMNSQPLLQAQATFCPPTERDGFGPLEQSARETIFDSEELTGNQNEARGGELISMEALRETKNGPEPTPLPEQRDFTLLKSQSELNEPAETKKTPEVHKVVEPSNEMEPDRQDQAEGLIEPENAALRIESMTDQQAAIRGGVDLIRGSAIEDSTETGIETTNHQRNESDQSNIRDVRPEPNTVLPRLALQGETVANTSKPSFGIVVQTGDSHGRALRRVSSESEALKHETRKDATSFKQPSKILRTVSDPSGLDVGDSCDARLNNDRSDGPSGPWTSDEAFLLFDWWPTELKKPAYWMAAPEAPVVLVPPSVVSAAPGFWGGITTARQFLRDDINVL